MATRTRIWPRVTARPFLYVAPASRGGYSVTVPEGVLLKPCDGEAGVYWVDELAWLKGDAIAHHDATFYGIRVPEAETRERGAVPTAARFDPVTRTIRSAPGNHWLATADGWDGAIAHDATAAALAAGLGFLHRLAALGATDAPPLVEQLEAIQTLASEAAAIVESFPRASVEG